MNKIITGFALLCSFIIFSACGNKTIPTTAEVNYLTAEDGTITMRAVGEGMKKTEALMNAELNAFNTILFRGMPQSQQKQPLIETNETGIKNKHPQYFESFYNEKRYKSFLMSSVVTGDYQKIPNNKFRVAIDITINVNALKYDLEQSGIIRKFGY
jgi:hypothetical protein